MILTVFLIQIVVSFREGERFMVEDNPAGYVSPMHNIGSNIVLMTNPDDELFKMELTFRNQIQKDDKLISLGQPLMNDEGIKAVIGCVQAIVSRVTIMSNFNKQDVPTLIDFLADTLARDLMIHRKKYGIKTSATRSNIYFIALTTAYVTMKRAYEEGEKRFWKGSQQELVTRVESTGANKKSILPSWMGWGSG